jgi:ElaB/YqjD/DUF883 family membrane-anchored ribosome-binding protein
MDQTFQAMNFRSCSRVGYEEALSNAEALSKRSLHMPETRSPNSDFNRAFGDAKKQAAGVADEVTDAAQDLYDQAADSASQVADATTRAARKTAGSFEKALRNTIENQPYTAVVVALAMGWLFGRMHRPL